MPATCFVQIGNEYSIADEGSIHVLSVLPAKNYIVRVKSDGNFFLVPVDDFVMPKRMYGNTLRHAQRIMSTFQDRPASTGIMLCGEQGSGKTLLAKELCVEATAIGIPTICVNADFCGDTFNKFIQDIHQPAIILFDEFEKVYDDEHQEQLLTLLDGVFPSKKMFILTCNDKYRVNRHLRNRPGRIFYMLDFVGLDEAFVREYCAENLEKRQYIEEVCNLTNVFKEFTFDMMKALVEEMNRYGESPREALSMLNVKIESETGNTRYDAKLTIDGKEVEVHNDDLYTNPMSHGVNVTILEKAIIDGEEDVEYVPAGFKPTDIVKFNAKQGSFGYEKLGDVGSPHVGKTMALTLTAQRSASTDLMALAF